GAAHLGHVRPVRPAAGALRSRGGAAGGLERRRRGAEPGAARPALGAACLPPRAGAALALRRVHAALPRLPPSARRLPGAGPEEGLELRAGLGVAVLRRRPQPRRAPRPLRAGALVLRRPRGAGAARRVARRPAGPGVRPRCPERRGLMDTSGRSGGRPRERPSNHTPPPPRLKKSRVSHFLPRSWAGKMG